MFSHANQLEWNKQNINSIYFTIFLTTTAAATANITKAQNH